MANLEIANIVASGRLGRELDLAAVSESPELNKDSRLESIKHSKKSGERVLVRFSTSNTLGILSRKGACIITGASSLEEVEQTEEIFLDALENAGVIPEPSIENFAIQNIVFTSTIEDSLDLNAIAIMLGFENVEYEPEQFPGLVYRPEDTSCVILIFGTGKLVVTGGRSEEEAQEAVESLKKDLEGLG